MVPFGRERGDVAGQVARLGRLGLPLLVVGTAGGSWISGSVAQRLIAAASVRCW
jgi:hypothetical protein